jgi:hypothetical protein
MKTGERIVSQPVFRGHRERKRAYVSWEAGEGITHDGRALAADPRAPVSRLLSDLPPDVEQVFLCDKPGGAASVPAWIREPALLAEWEDRGTHPDPDQFVIRLSHRKSGRRVTLYGLAPWFGWDAHPRAARAAFTVLGELLKTKFPGAYVLPTPGQTGLDLWDRRRGGSEYPVLPDELLDLIRSTSGQGRVELCPAPGRETVPGFYYFDTRFAYAAHVRGMPVCEPLVDDVPERAAYQPGRYRIRFRVPEGWRHLGIFPVKAPERDPLSGDLQWFYPSEPSTEWETWADDSELRVAERFGWPYTILQRILWEEPDKKETAPEPLRYWRDNLVALREQAERMGAQQTIPAPLASMVSGALRNILLHAIGSFHRSRRAVIYVVRKTELARVPAHLEPSIELHGDLATYRETVALSREQKRYAHPEWSAAIWAKTRANMLHFHTRNMERQGLPPTGVLTLPREDVIAIRTDALYLAVEPGWEDRGKVGEFKLKGAIREPVPVPGRPAELNALRDRAERATERGDADA